MKHAFAALCLLVLAMLACSGQSAAVAPSPVPIRTVPDDSLQMGVAGLITRNYPEPSQQDWINFYETLPETGSLLGVYTNWTDSPDTAGQIPKVITDVTNLSKQYPFLPVFALSVFRDEPDGRSVTTLDLSNPQERLAFKQAAVGIAEKVHPPYLGLGIEINRLAEEELSSYQAFVNLYIETYREIKSVSPDTRVFTIFQYELLRGGVFFSGDQQKKASWELFDAFAGYNDLAAFTSYPFLLYDTPADMPVAYYSEINLHTTHPVVFTELGWPSKPLSIAPDSIYGGSQQEQEAFVERFFELTHGLDLKLALWTFPHDVGSEFNPAFTSISLRENNGRPKSALSVWQSHLP